MIWSKEKKVRFSKQLERFREIFLFDSFALNDLVVDVLELKLQSVQGVLLLEMSINQKANFLLINLCEKNPPPFKTNHSKYQLFPVPALRDAHEKSGSKLKLHRKLTLPFDIGKA